MKKISSKIYALSLAVALLTATLALCAGGARAQQQSDDEDNARGIFQRQQGDGFMLDILLKRPYSDTWVNVPPDTVFHNGDRVKLALRSNFDGYIYIVNIGTSGARRIMVPGQISSENHLQKGVYQQFLVGELAGSPGDETLYIISAPTKIAEFETAIANNQGLLPEPQETHKEETVPTKPIAEPKPLDNKLKTEPDAALTFKNKSKIGVLKSVGNQVIKILGVVSLFSRDVTSEYSAEESRTFIASPQRLKGGEFVAFELVLRHEK